jgi:hypothetical protein
VEWREDVFIDPATPMIFGILGDDPFGAIIDAVKARRVNGRKIKFQYYSSIEDVKACDILFISSSERARLPAILKHKVNSHMLLVGDMEGFARMGGMINFFVRDNNVGFEINVNAIDRAGIMMHSRLLNMAVVVHDASEPESE